MPPPVVPRDYRRVDRRTGSALVDLLEQRLTDYQAVVHRSTDAAGIGEVLERRRIGSLVVPAGVPDAWREALPASVRAVADEPPLSSADLDGIDGVLTGCRLAIAETGTLVLDAGPDQGRRVLSLVPDYCLVVVRADQIVAGVPQAVAALDPSRPLTWVSGPSATSDIELDRVEGVHGPRTLDVVLLVGP
jgi:L-lactate dehydrogenase complex protein LldG